MNTTEDAMHTLPTGNTLIAHNVALQAAGNAIELVGRVPARFRSLQDQVIRSASSVPANLAEGHGRSGKDRMYFYRVAYGSANEVAVHLRLLAASGAVDPAGVDGILEQFDQVWAMTWRLMHPKP